MAVAPATCQSSGTQTLASWVVEGAAGHAGASVGRPDAEPLPLGGALLGHPAKADAVAQPRRVPAGGHPSDQATAALARGALVRGGGARVQPEAHEPLAGKLPLSHQTGTAHEL